MPRTDRSLTQPSPAMLRAALDRRSFLRMAGLTGLGATGAATLAACGGGSSSSSSSTSSSGGSSASYGALTVQLSWIKNIEFAGEFMADSKGYFKKAGFSATTLIAGGSAGTSAEAAVTTGKAFAGLSSPSLTAPAINQGGTLKIVGSTYQKNPFCILSLSSNPITSPQEMVGKKIGVQAGGNTTIFEALCKANNIDITKITQVPVQYDPTVVTTGQVDGYLAYITNEPFLLEAKGSKVTTFLFADHGLPLASETVVVTQDSIDKDRDKVKAFLKAEIMGWTDALNDPAAAVTLSTGDARYGKSLKLDPAEQTKEITAQAQLIVSADTVKNGIFTMTDEFIAENIKSLAASGITITAKKLFDMSLINEIYKETPSLISAVTATPTAAS